VFVSFSVIRAISEDLQIDVLDASMFRPYSDYDGWSMLAFVWSAIEHKMHNAAYAGLLRL
jgi:hypothetical protein